MREPRQDIRCVGVAGTGLIGSSWAALFLARGFDVTASDPAPDAERNLREFIARAWPALTELGLSPGASPDRLHFDAALEAALEKADFVQESGPEREDIKVRLFAELDAFTPPDVILASSSSGLTMSAIQAGCGHPQRCVIGHPFNPPHLIPLVEVVAGRATSAETVGRAVAFYRGIGKKPIQLEREVPGHVANRLQAALWREAVHLVAEGVASVADIDDAVCWGPGLRWGLMGPHLVLHLGGGPGGMEHFMHHLSGPFSRWWEDLGRPVLTSDLKQKIIDGVHDEAAGRTVAELERVRDEQLIRLLRLRAGPAAPSP